MTAGYMIFMVFITVSLSAMVTAWVRTILFFKRHKKPEQSSLNPIDGIALWMRMLTTKGFGDEAEPVRRSITRTYLLAIVVFLFAILLFYTLPGMPG